MKIELTKHGEERMKDRIRVKGAKNVCERANKAWERGRTEHDFESAHIRKYLRSILTHGTGQDKRTARVYGNDIYIFTVGGRLITAFPMGKNLIAMRGKISCKNYKKHLTNNRCSDIIYLSEKH